MAVDNNVFAIHSKLANCAKLAASNMFFGSINDFLLRVLQGDPSLPPIGSIQMVAAGSPCVGFSRANANRDSPRSRRNCALLTTALACVDIYRPLYVLLENVLGMGDGHPNACDQALCALLGMGYQVRKMELNARDFGSLQNRPRIFIVAAAPNVVLPDEPLRSCDQKHATKLRTLQNLPSIENDTTHCIRFPMHIPGKREGDRNRELVESIPVDPPGMSLYKTAQMDLLPVKLRAWFEELKYENPLKSQKGSKSFTRQDWTKAIPTVRSACSPGDAIQGGHILHPDQHRTCSLQEVVLIQGFGDDEVFVGSKNEQWRQVGNSVNRCVSKALGFSIKNALRRSANKLEQQSRSPLLVAVNSDSKGLTEKRFLWMRQSSAEDTRRTVLVGHILEENSLLVKEQLTDNISQISIEDGGDRLSKYISPLIRVPLHPQPPINTLDGCAGSGRPVQREADKATRADLERDPKLRDIIEISDDGTKSEGDQGPPKKKQCRRHLPSFVEPVGESDETKQVSVFENSTVSHIRFANGQAISDSTTTKNERRTITLRRTRLFQSTSTVSPSLKFGTQARPIDLTTSDQ